MPDTHYDKALRHLTNAAAAAAVPAQAVMDIVRGYLDTEQEPTKEKEPE